MKLLPVQRLLSVAGWAALLFSTAFSLPVAAQSDSGGIHVQVLSAQTNRPISGVSITVKSRDGAVNSATSDETGMVILESLEVGLYELDASPIQDGAYYHAIRSTRPHRSVLASYRMWI